MLSENCKQVPLLFVLTCKALESPQRNEHPNIGAEEAAYGRAQEHHCGQVVSKAPAIPVREGSPARENTYHATGLTLDGVSTRSHTHSQHSPFYAK